MDTGPTGSSIAIPFESASNQSDQALHFNRQEIYEDKDQFWKDLTVLLLYAATVIVSLYGNIVVCYVAFVLRAKSPTYLLIGNMAVSDLISGLTIPFQWLFCSTSLLNELSERPCGLVKSLQVVSYYISTMTMATIAIDRFMLLKNPLANRIDPQSAIIIIWSLSLVICIPTLFSMRVSEYFTPKRLILCRIVAQTDNKWNRYIRKYRVLFVIFTQYLIPLVIASIFYSKCIRIIMSRRRIGEHTTKQQLQFDQSRVRTIKMLLISLSAFSLGWFPVHLVHFVDFYLVPLLPRQCNSTFFYNFFYWVAISSCCYNPFIYSWFDHKFRSTARLSCYRRQATTEITHISRQMAMSETKIITTI